MSECVELFRAMDLYEKGLRADRRKLAPDILRQNNINFTSHNEGAHLRVAMPNGKVVNFWPGTDKFTLLNGKYRHGIKALIAYVTKPVKVAK